MNTIKFSHKYSKFPQWIENQDIAVLFHVFKTHYNELSPQFIDYDTHYFQGEIDANYELPKTELLVLIFELRYLGVFTTIRRWTPEKEKYYKSKIGEEFKIEIEVNAK